MCLRLCAMASEFRLGSFLCFSAVLYVAFRPNQILDVPMTDRNITDFYAGAT
jgi:hypothetical protein